MSLAATSLMETVKKQYLFKLKANIDTYSGLVAIQVLGLLFSLGGIGGFGYHYFEVTYFSANIVIAFTIFWGLVSGITIMTKPVRDVDFTFVTNRLSSTLSNILFLMTASLLGAVTAMLSRYVLIFISNFFMDKQLFYDASMTMGDFFLGILTTFLYIFLVSAVGYLIGTLVQVSRLFIFLIPVLFFGSMMVDTTMLGREPVVAKWFSFYFLESSLWLFVIKTLVTSALCYLASLAIFNRMEVRR